MSEYEYASQRKPASPQAYDKQKAPYQKNRYDKDRWSTIRAENRVMERKLRELQREPPSNFHAPKGYASVAGGKAKQQAQNGKPQSEMTETRTYVPPTAWPPMETLHQKGLLAKHQREIALVNARIRAKLQETYSKQPDVPHTYLKRPDASLQRHGLAWQALDCNDRWQMRTSLYETAQPNALRGVSSAAVAPSTAPTPDLEAASLPKSLGVAQCGGCARKCFYAADGPKLSRCRKCKQQWYCSEACAALDWLSHKALCKYNSNGHWAPYGRKPSEEHWVNNAAMAEVLSTLRKEMAAATPSPQHTQRTQQHRACQRPSSAPGVRGSGAAGRTSSYALDKDEIDGQVDLLMALQQRYQELRQRELAAEAEQQQVEYRADNGLDGPRPCMFQMKRFAPLPTGQGGTGPSKGVKQRPASAGGASTAAAGSSRG